jgi:hypothetical protein
MYHMTTMSGSEENQARTLRTILLWTEEKMKSAKIRQARQQQASPHPGCLPRRLRLTFHMKALVTFAHRPAGLTLRENVLNLGFTARQIAVGWFP